MNELNLRRLTTDERVKDLGNGEISVTNACGFMEVTFDVEASTNGIGKTFTTNESLGEWCRVAYRLGERYFLVIESGDIVSHYPVTESEDGKFEAIAHIDKESLEYLREISKLNLEDIIIEDIPVITLHPEFPNPNDKHTQEWVEESDSLIIIEHQEDSVVVIKRGVILDRIFPDIQAYEKKLD